MDTRLRQVAVTLALAAVYFIAARFGLSFRPVSGFATFIWPPAGIALAAILLFDNRVAPGILLGACAANLVSGASVPVAIGIGLGNTCEALVGATLLRGMPSFSITLERVSSVIALIVWSALVSTLIGATAGVMTLYAGGIVDAAHIGDAWRAWWIGDMVGVLLLAPVILVWARTPQAEYRVRWLETTTLVGSILVACALAFFNTLIRMPRLASPFHHADLLVVVLLWAPMRFGQRGATTAVLGVSVLALVAAVLGVGPFRLPTLSERLLPLQTFMALVAATSLVVAATMAERRIADQVAEHARMVAEQANSAKSQFLRVMSHELRTPLNAIQGFAQLLATGVYGALNEKQADAVKRIEQNERSLLAIIDEMLGYVDAERKPMTENTDVVVVAEAFDAVERSMATGIEGKYLVVKRELGDARLAVCADPKGLQQILASLVSNAIKYNGNEGTITLAADRAGDGKVCIEVRDTGVGIKKEEMERVFEPFFQADSGTTRQYSGVGLGLTIARDLARRMHGEVTIVSEEGRGTSAMVVLPAGSATPVGELEQRPAREVAA